MTDAVPSSPVSRLFLFGCGAHARKLYYYIVEQRLRFGGFVSELSDEAAPLPGLPFKTFDLLEPPTAGDAILIAVGNSAIRSRLTRQCANAGWRLGSMIHPTAYCAPDAEIGEGTVVCAGAIVETGARIGRGVIVDIGALVDHDATVSDFSHVRAGEIRIAGSS